MKFSEYLTLTESVNTVQPENNESCINRRLHVDFEDMLDVEY